MDGVELIEAGPRPHFWRAWTDNDRGNGMPTRCAAWKAASQNWQVGAITTELLEADSSGPARIVVHAEGELPDVGAPYSLRYTVWADGEIEIEAEMGAGRPHLAELPRFGLQMRVKDAFDTLEWYGRGPHESYSDRKASAAVDVYRGSVDEQYFEYSEPQETGNKTDVRWARLVRADGLGLEAGHIDTPLSVTALRYTTEDMEPAKHFYELERQPFVVFNIDHGQTGVGGDNSWGARTHDRYTLKAGPYAYRFRLRATSGTVIH